MTVAEALKKAIADKGSDVLCYPKQLHSFVLDYTDRYDKQLKLFELANAHGICLMVREMLACDNAEERVVLEAKAVSKLISEAFMSEENAAEAVRIIMCGAGIAEDTAKESGESFTPEEQLLKGADYLLGKGVKRDWGLAVQMFRTPAEDGNATACFALGLCYYHGLGVIADPEKAFKWLSKGAKGGNHGAKKLLGDLYLKGDGVPCDLNKALACYREAAAAGVAEAQNRLGLCYYHGIGVAQDYREAAKLFEGAAGSAAAISNLATCYFTGKGVAKNEEKAAKLYEKAAELGERGAAAYLAECYRHGKGVERDPQKAAYWDKRAKEG